MAEKTDTLTIAIIAQDLTTRALQTIRTSLDATQRSMVALDKRGTKLIADGMKDLTPTVNVARSSITKLGNTIAKRIPAPLKAFGVSVKRNIVNSLSTAKKVMVSFSARAARVVAPIKSKWASLRGAFVRFGQAMAPLASKIGTLLTPLRGIGRIAGGVALKGLSSLGMGITIVGAGLGKLGAAAAKGLAVVGRGAIKAAGAMGKLALKVSGGIVSAFQKLGSVAGMALSGLAKGAAAGLTAIAGLGAGVLKLAADSASLVGVQKSFNDIAASTGKSGDEMLAALKKGSNGLIANRDLMLTYNQAASLVSKDFANMLPDAMSKLSKMAAATGTDMDYMLASLTTGVGRLSPAILDNLNIQVSLAEATKRASEMYGVQASQLTKEQKQMGMMAVTLDKLEVATANMPEVSQSAAAMMQQFKIKIADLKDEIGLAFIPALLAIGQPMLDLANKYGPMVTDWAEGFGKWMGYVIPDILNGDFSTVISSISGLIARTFGGEGKAAFDGFRETVSNLGTTIRVGLGDAWTFIKDKTAGVVEWYKANLPLIQQTGETLAAFWQNNIVPALSTAWDTIKDVVSSAITIVEDVITIAMNAINGNWGDAWEGIKQLVADVWEGIKTIFLGAVDTILNVMGLSLKQFKTIWSDNLEQAKTIIDLALANIKTAIANFDLAEAGHNLIMGFVDGIKNAIGAVVDAASEAATAAVNAVKGKLGISSPSKVFIDIGRNTMEAWGKAVNESKTAPINATSLASQAVAASASRQHTSQTVSNNTTRQEIVVNINVNGDAVGVDWDEVARRVGRILGQEALAYA